MGTQNINEELFNKLVNGDLSDFFKSGAIEFKSLMTYYKCAMMEIATKFNVLNEELSMHYDRNPIEYVTTRIKSPESIFAKLTRKDLPITVESIEKNLSDIAGVRVVCGFPSDIYRLSDAFLTQDDIKLIEKKDYIKNPKKNGYRSLHLIIETPIFLHDQKRKMRVEVQFRTISMDWWASLEHKIRYKKDVVITDEIAKELLMCANIGASLDERMEIIQDKVEKQTNFKE